MKLSQLPYCLLSYFRIFWFFVLLSVLCFQEKTFIDVIYLNPGLTEPKYALPLQTVLV